MAEQDSSVSYQFTKLGNDLSVKALAGTVKLDFTKAELSTDNHFSDTEADVAIMTDMGNVAQTVELKEVDAVEDDQSYVKVPVLINEAEITEDYALMTIGLYCKPDDGDEVLYSICSLKDPIYMHKSSNNSTFAFNLNTLVGSAANVTIKVDPAGAVTNADLAVTLKPYATIKYVDDSIAALPSQTVKDDRDVDWTPKQYMDNGTKVTREFKTKDVLGLTGQDFYLVITDTPWANDTGGYPRQYALDNRSNTFSLRIGISDTEWGPWTSIDVSKLVTLTQLNTAIAGIKLPDLSGYALKSTLPDFSSFATAKSLSDAIAAIPKVDLTPYAKTADMTTKLAAKADATTVTNLTTTVNSKANATNVVGIDPNTSQVTNASVKVNSGQLLISGQPATTLVGAADANDANAQTNSSKDALLHFTLES